jgi:hypothetical protein
MVQTQKRAKITQETKRLILERSLERPPDGGPRIPRTALAEKLLVEIKALRQDEPDLAVLERMISHYRNNTGRGPQEEPWDLRTLNKYPLPPEALPAVMEVWMSLKLGKGFALSIRQAKWVSWLYPFFKDGKELLVVAVLLHSWLELLEEILGNFDWNWQYSNADLYQRVSGKMLPKGVALELTREEPITCLGVQYFKNIVPLKLQKGKKQKKVKGAKK